MLKAIPLLALAACLLSPSPSVAQTPANGKTDIVLQKVNQSTRALLPSGGKSTNRFLLTDIRIPNLPPGSTVGIMSGPAEAPVTMWRFLTPLKDDVLDYHWSTGIFCPPGGKITVEVAKPGNNAEYRFEVDWSGKLYEHSLGP
jgi:hypothetical protein